MTIAHNLDTMQTRGLENNVVELEDSLDHMIRIRRRDLSFCPEQCHIRLLVNATNPRLGLAMSASDRQEDTHSRVAAVKLPCRDIVENTYFVILSSPLRPHFPISKHASIPDADRQNSLPPANDGGVQHIPVSIFSCFKISLYPSGLASATNIVPFSVR